MAKIKKVKSKISVDITYKHTLFTKDLYKVNKTIDTNIEKYFDKLYASQLRQCQENISSIKYVANYSPQTKLHLKTKLVSESMKMLTESTRLCLGVYFERELAIAKYEQYLNSLSLTPVDNVVGEVKLHLGIVDSNTSEYKKHLEDTQIIQDFTERTIKDVPLAHFDGQSYLPSVQVFSYLYFGILIHKLPSKSLLPYLTCIEKSVDILEIFDNTFKESTKFGYAIINDNFDIGEIVNEPLDIDGEAVCNLNVSLVEGKTKTLKVYDVAGKKAVSLLSLVSLLTMLNLDCDNVIKHA